MSRGNRLSSFEILGWAGLGLLTGLVTGFALSEWVGGVNQRRVKRMVTRRRGPRPALTPAACARAAAQALGADPALRDLGLQATAVAAGVVELHGWVSTRALRTRAGTVARGVAGIDRVVNSILVRGEDDLEPGNVADQSA